MHFFVFFPMICQNSTTQRVRLVNVPRLVILVESKTFENRNISIRLECSANGNIPIGYQKFLEFFICQEKVCALPEKIFQHFLYLFFHILFPYFFSRCFHHDIFKLSHLQIIYYCLALCFDIKSTQDKILQIPFYRMCKIITHSQQTFLIFILHQTQFRSHKFIQISHRFYSYIHFHFHNHNHNHNTNKNDASKQPL